MSCYNKNVDDGFVAFVVVLMFGLLVIASFFLGMSSSKARTTTQLIEQGAYEYTVDQTTGETELTICNDVWVLITERNK